MATTRENIRKWLRAAKKEGATHVVIATDTFDHDDFPVSVMPGQDVHEVVREYQNAEKMLRVMEVYALHSDLEKQLNTARVFNYDAPLLADTEMSKGAKARSRTKKAKVLVDNKGRRRVLKKKMKQV